MAVRGTAVRRPLAWVVRVRQGWLLLAWLGHRRPACPLHPLPPPPPRVCLGALATPVIVLLPLLPPFAVAVALVVARQSVEWVRWGTALVWRGRVPKLPWLWLLLGLGRAVATVGCRPPCPCPLLENDPRALVETTMRVSSERLGLGQAAGLALALAVAVAAAVERVE